MASSLCSPYGLVRCGCTPETTNQCAHGRLVTSCEKGLYELSLNPRIPSIISKHYIIDYCDTSPRKQKCHAVHILKKFSGGGWGTVYIPHTQYIAYNLIYYILSQVKCNKHNYKSLWYQTVSCVVPNIGLCIQPKKNKKKKTLNGSNLTTRLYTIFVILQGMAAFLWHVFSITIVVFLAQK